MIPQLDPCVDVDCGPGQNFALDSQWKQKSAWTSVNLLTQPEQDPLPMCFSDNVTNTSWCEFHRLKCNSPEMANVIVEYYGACKGN